MRLKLGKKKKFLPKAVKLSKPLKKGAKKSAKIFQEKILISKKNKPFLVLDIGTEAVKSIICFASPKFRFNGTKTGFASQKLGFSETKIEDKKSIIAAGAGLDYFRKSDIFDSGKFQIDEIKRAVLDAINNARQNLSFSSINKDAKKRIQKQKKWDILLGLPSNLLKARVVEKSISREKPRYKITKKENKNICKKIFELAKKEVSQKFAKEFGILPSDVYWTSLKIIDLKIDGYKVPDCKGYQGRKIEFKILASFLPKYYLNNIKRILKPLQFKTLNIVHIAESIDSVLKDGGSGFFIDVGGRMTQIFVLKNGKIGHAGEFERGSRFFRDDLFEKLGVDSNTARQLMENYSRKSLSSSAMERIKEIFSQEKKNWYDILIKEIEKAGLSAYLSSNVFLFGGGSIIPEIENVLEENSSGNVEFISLKDFDNIKDASRILDSPQYISSLLIALVL